MSFIHIFPPIHHHTVESALIMMIILISVQSSHQNAKARRLYQLFSHLYMYTKKNINDYGFIKCIFMLYAVILKWFVPLQPDELYKVFMQLQCFLFFMIDYCTFFSKLGYLLHV